MTISIAVFESGSGVSTYGGNAVRDAVRRPELMTKRVRQSKGTTGSSATSIPATMWYGAAQRTRVSRF